MPKKVVLDTNVFVAAHFNKISASAKIIDLCLQNKLRFCASEGLFKELEFILKNIRAPIAYKDKIYRLFDKVSLVKPKKLLIIKEDLDDNKFLAVAEKAEADFLITSDHHLLVLKKFKDTQIIKPADFLLNIVLSDKNR